MRFPSVLLAVAIPLATGTMSYAQPAPKLGGAFPLGGQRGASVEVGLYGENLVGATGVIFSGEGGLTATITPPAAPPISLLFSAGGVKPAKPANEPARAKIDIAAGAPCGRRELRVVTPAGVSDPVSFYVGDLPEMVALAPSGTAALAQEIPLPITINSSIGAPAEVDHYKFKATKGQRLIFDLQAQRIRSTLDGSMALLDAAGKTLAEDEDTNGLDPLIDYTVPADGEYVLSVRDSRYQGSAGHHYRLSAGQLPYLDGIFPLGAARGQKLDVTLRGRNLGAVSTQSVSVDSNAPAGTQELRAATPQGLSNPRPFVIGGLAEFMETEPNNEREKANAVTVPITINGRAGQAGDVDTFKIPGEAGASLVIDVQARRLGSPFDALLTLTKADGTKVAQNDDAAGADAVIEYGVPEAGDYFLSIRDLLERGGEEFSYRITIYKRTPDFGLVFFPDTNRIRRGGRTVVGFEAQRGPGFGGPLLISAKDLPAGVSAESMILPITESKGFLTLAASADAELGVKPLHLYAEGALGGTRARRDGRSVDGEKEKKSVMEGFLDVLEAAPFEVDLVSLNGALDQAGSTTIEVQAKRRESFKGEITLSVRGLPRDLNAPEVKLAPDQNTATMTIGAGPNADEDRIRIYVMGESRGVRAVSAPMDFEIREIPFVISASLPRLTLTALPEGSTSAANEATFTVNVLRRGWFAGGVNLALEGLPPEGIKAEFPESIPQGIGDATIKLHANDKAKTDAPIQLFVIARQPIGARNYEHRIGPITVTVSPPVATEAPTVVASPAK